LDELPFNSPPHSHYFEIEMYLFYQKYFSLS
jgi:hypothetical protein